MYIRFRAIFSTVSVFNLQNIKYEWRRIIVSEQRVFIHLRTLFDRHSMHANLKLGWIKIWPIKNRVLPNHRHSIYQLASMEFHYLESKEGIVIPERVISSIKIAQSLGYRYIHDSSRTYAVSLVLRRSRLKGVWGKRERLGTRLVCNNLNNKLVTCSSLSWAQCVLKYFCTTV